MVVAINNKTAVQVELFLTNLIIKILLTFRKVALDAKLH